jgi:phosphoribosylformylglycinamidine synthase
MKGKESALYSHYIIDGYKCDMTPAELLDECMYESDGLLELPEFDDIIDEPTEAPLSVFEPDSSQHEKYLEQTLAASHDERQFIMLYPEHSTRMQIAKTLLGRLWSEGHFRLGDLRLWAQWEWNTRPIGNMAAFYTSAASASEYIYALGISMEDYVFIEGDESSTAKFFAWLPENEGEDENIFKTSPYESTHPWISESRKCSATLQNDPETRLIYIPFDTCRFKLGGSLLAQENGDNGGLAPEISDPDYFIDCYEVVRELTEDGIIISGATVADGGLITAAARMCKDCGCDLDISRLAASYQEKDTTKILFGEVPGVLIQVSEDNFDYVDSQFILQDVAYFPIGFPTSEHQGVKVIKTEKNGIADILASLLGQASEGED